jgi:diaminopimelate epimerase
MIRFTKMHGAGNDYVYVDCFAQPTPADPAGLSRRLSDRHFGVGGDGLVLITPSDKADARMRMFNADGSESEMCGNAVRCVAKYVFDRGIVRKSPLRIETGYGVLSIEVDAPAGRVRRATVDMGRPTLEAAQIPVLFSGIDAAARVIDLPLADHVPAAWFAGWSPEAGLDPRATCVSMGNPHLVLYCRDVARVPLETVGPLLENAPTFPRRINVHFVQVQSAGEVIMRTWERGSGVTLACGTGASAVCVAGVLAGRNNRNILAHLPGGDLELRWADDDHVFMTGPAEEVFTGEWMDAENPS